MGATELVRESLQVAEVAVGEHQPGAIRRQQTSAGGPQAAGAAGDDCHFAFKFEIDWHDGLLTSEFGADGIRMGADGGDGGHFRGRVADADRRSYEVDGPGRRLHGKASQLRVA